MARFITTIKGVVAIFIMSFCFVNIVKADYAENFDIYSLGNLNNNFNWLNSSASVQVENSVSSSSPNAISDESSGVGNINFYGSADDDFVNASFDFYLTSVNTSGQLLVRPQASSSYMLTDIYIQTNNVLGYGDVYIKNETTGAHETLVAKNNLTVGVWHTLFIQYDKINHLVKAKIDSNEWTAYIASDNQTHDQWNKLTLGYNGADYFGAYFDNFNLENTPTSTISIIDPTEGYNINFIQPAPIIFEYTNPNGSYDTAIIELDYLSVPQFSSELTYHIETVSTSTIGVVYANLMNGSWKARASLWNSTNWTKSSSSPYVNFTVSSSTVPTNTLPETGLTDYNFNVATSSISTTTIHTMVCSTEEWASGNWWDKISCSVSEVVWRTGVKLSDLAKDTFSKISVAFSVVFPFNIPLQIKNCWTSSENAELPSELSFIANYVDSSGNITVNFPNGFGVGATTTPVLVFGESLFREPANGTSDKFFAFIVIFSKYLQWALFCWSIWSLGKSTYEDLINIKKEDTI